MLQAVESRNLVGLAVQGDEEAFAELYSHHSCFISNLVLRSTRNAADAEDICQEVWLKVHTEIGRLRTPEAFAGWLRCIASRACVDFARRRKPSSSLTWDIAEPPDRSVPEDVVAEHEERKIVWQALASLAPRQSTALFLREVEGYEYRRIAETIETSVSGVETLLFRARKALAKSYGALETSKAERCRQAHGVMAAVLDGEGGPVKRRSLQAHVDSCPTCRRELESMTRTSRAYAALLLLPVAGGWHFLAGGSSAALSTLGAGKLTLLLAKLKALLVPALVATSVTTAVIAVPVVIELQHSGSEASVAVDASSSSPAIVSESLAPDANVSIVVTESPVPGQSAPSTAANNIEAAATSSSAPSTSLTSNGEVSLNAATTTEASSPPPPAVETAIEASASVGIDVDVTLPPVPPVTSLLPSLPTVSTLLPGALTQPLAPVKQLLPQTPALVVPPVSLPAVQAPVLPLPPSLASPPKPPVVPTQPILLPQAPQLPVALP